MPLPLTPSLHCPYCDGKVEFVGTDLYRCLACLQWLPEESCVDGGVQREVDEDDDEDEDDE